MIRQIIGRILASLIHRRTLVAILLVLALLIIAAIAAFYVVSLIRMAHLPAPTQFANPQAVITTVSKQLTGQDLVVTSASGIGGLTAQGYVAYTLPPYRITKEYQTVPTHGAGQGILSDITTSKTNYQQLQDFATSQHFIAVGGADAHSGKSFPSYLMRPYTGTVQSYALYDAASIRCVIWRMDITGLSPGNAITSIGCADKGDYKQVAEIVAPFYDAYAKRAGNPTDSLVFGLPVTSNGQDGFRSTKIYQETTAKDPGRSPTNQADSPRALDAWYYKTTDTTEWTLFAAALGTPSCSAYTTETIKKAFKGTNCWNETRQTNDTVQ